MTCTGNHIERRELYFLDVTSPPMVRNCSAILMQTSNVCGHAGSHLIAKLKDCVVRPMLDPSWRATSASWSIPPRCSCGRMGHFSLEGIYLQSDGIQSLSLERKMSGDRNMPQHRGQ